MIDMTINPSRTKAELDLLAAFDHHADHLPGADLPWLQAARADAIEKFRLWGLPHRRVEEWKYTDLRARMIEAQPIVDWQKPAAIAAPALPEHLSEIWALDAYKIVFLDGVLQPKLSDHAAMSEHVRFRELSAALAAREPWLESSLDRVNPPLTEAVVALNTALMHSGAVIDIAGGADLDKPIHVVYLSGDEYARAQFLRNVVRVGAGAHVTLLESHIGLGAQPVQSNVATELAVGARARVQHIKVQHKGAKAVHIGNWMIDLAEGAQYRAFQLAIGAALTRSQIFLKFSGDHAEAELNGATMMRERQHCDLTLVVNHASPHCRSRELFKAVLDDEARGVFQGKVVVQQRAQKTDGKQMAQALLLSELAEFNAKPELEIYADDVACGHGATSGQIDENLLFYLRSRGIPEGPARALLIQAFIAEAVAAVENDAVREALDHAIEGWLAGKA